MLKVKWSKNISQRDDKVVQLYTMLYPGQMLSVKMMGKVITGSWFVGFDLYVLTYLDDQLPVSNR